MRTLLGLLFIAIATPAAAAKPCITIEQDKQAAKANGFQWLGTGFVGYSSASFVYYRRQGMTYASLMVGGCVAQQAIVIGPYVPQAEL